MARLRGFLWLLAGLIVAFLAAIVAYLTLSRASEVASGQVVVRGDRRPVVVVTQRVPVRAMLSAEMVTLVELPVEGIPDDAATEIGQVAGKLTLAELYPGEVVLLPRLIDANVISGDGRIALAMAEDQVLMAIPASDRLSVTGVLKPGDQVDILVSMGFPNAESLRGGESVEGKTEMVTYILLQNVRIAALPGATLAGDAKGDASKPGTPPTALLVTVSPQDALILKYALDAGAVQDVTLRAPGVDQEWSTEPINVDYIIDAYQIPVQ